MKINTNGGAERSQSLNDMGRERRRKQRRKGGRKVERDQKREKSREGRKEEVIRESHRARNGKNLIGK